MNRTTTERLEECTKITQRLNELGIPLECPGRVMLRDIFRDWIHSGEAYVGNVPFNEWKRSAYILLPGRKDRQVVFVLRHIK
jgi:hypothetical protein